MRLSHLTAAAATLLFFTACGETPSDPQAATPELAFSAEQAVLPPGKGLQLYNDNQSCEGFPVCRGVYVVGPFFDPTPVEVKTGTWVTLGIAVRTPCSPSPEPVEADLIDFLVNGLELELSFDGQAIPLVESIRWDQTTSEETACGYTVTTPVRYFVIPQSKGTYEYSAMALGSPSMRTVSWVAPGQAK